MQGETLVATLKAVAPNFEPSLSQRLMTRTTKVFGAWRPLASRFEGKK